MPLILSPPCQPTVCPSGMRLCASQRKGCSADPSQPTSSHPLRGLTKVNASYALWDQLIRVKNCHWHLAVKNECISDKRTPESRFDNSLFIAARRAANSMRSVGSCPLVDFRGLSRQSNMQDQQSFSLCRAGIVWCLEVDNLRDKGPSFYHR